MAFLWGIFILLAVAGLVVLYRGIDPTARLAYWMRVRASFGGGERCRECGNRALSADFPFCSEDHADQHAATTAW